MTVRTFRPTDSLYPAQWHFGVIGRTGFGSTNTAGIERVWADHTGAGVRVGIWDDGVQSSHWDLVANYNSSRQVTVGGLLNDGQPITAQDGHGTSVAGLIAASANGRGGVGVAFGAQVTGVRIFGGADDINTAWSRYLTTLDSLGNFDVTNHSYGGAPDFMVGGDVAKFERAAVLGRGGLGTINVKAAGNSNIDGNGEALDASRFTVTVAAVDANAQVTSYSTYGAHVLVANAAGAVTTDLLGGTAGYNGLEGGDCTNSFGGTSAATPVTSGVIALMLDAAPGLGWRDVQNILALSAYGSGSRYGGSTTNENFAWKWNGAANWNGGGMHFSEDYGYGVVNAFQAVRMAEVWGLMNPAAATSANEVRVSTGALAANLAINDLSTLSYTFQVRDSLNMEHVALTIDLTHTYFTDLRISLVSPAGTSLSLYNGSSGDASTADGNFSYAFGAEGYRGEDSRGTWTLVVTDAAAGDVGTLRAVSFQAYGSAATTADTYHYTDEVFAALAAPGQSARATLADVDGGTDWLDCAAMTGNLVLNLNAGGECSADGRRFAAVAAGTLLENATAGDGNDSLIGNALDNLLAGMRGNDTLDGGAGIDTAVFMGRFADYTVTSSGGRTLVTGAMGADVLLGIERLRFDDRTIDDPTWLASQAPAPAPAPAPPPPPPTELVGNNSGNVIFAGSGDTLLRGLAGNDTLYGGAGRDTLLGGTGNDVLYGGDNNDTLIGGAGRDVLTGGWGDNTFVYQSTGDSGTSVGQRDVITDFWQGHDKVDLSAIDANTRVSGDQAFAFGASAARNAVWFANGILNADVNGDARADLQIEIAGVQVLRATDLVL